MSDRAKNIGLIAILLGIFVLSWIISFEVSPDIRDELVRESGSIETASAIFYLVAIVLFVILFGVKVTRNNWYMPAAMLALALRELDAHKAFTTMSVFKSRFYLSSDVPMFEKLIGLTVIGLLVYMAYLLISRHLADFIVRLRRFDPTAIAVFLAFACAGVAKTLDGIGRKLADFNITVTQEYRDIFLVFEETLEFGIGIFFIYALFTYAKLSREAASS